MPIETENQRAATIPEADPPPAPKPKISESQIAASRANGAKSRGPTTPAGKAHSSANALRHGLTAKNLILKTESDAAFLNLLNDLEFEFSPASEIERDLITVMAQARWRALRTWCIEKAVLDDSMDTILQHRKNLDTPGCQGAAFIRLADHSHVLAMIDRNENRYERHYNRAFRALLAHRAYRTKTAEIDIKNDKTNPVNPTIETTAQILNPANPDSATLN